MTHHHLLIAAHESVLLEAMYAQRDAGVALSQARVSARNARRLLEAVDQT